MSKIEKLFSQFESKLNDRFRSDKTFREAKYEQIFIDSDPTSNKKYLRWILDSYVNNGIQHFEDLYGRVPDALEDYDYLVTSKKLSKGVKGEMWTNETVIDNFCGLAGCTKKGNEKLGLDDLLDKYYDIIEKRREKGEELENIISEREIICENDYFKIIRPLTQRASCYYGAGTKWCTAARSHNKFDYYNEQGGLYIFVPKHPEYNGEKYQLSETGQFMNEKDKRANLKEMMKTRTGFKECVLTVIISTSDTLCESHDIYILKNSWAKELFNPYTIPPKLSGHYVIISSVDVYLIIPLLNNIKVYDWNNNIIDFDELMYTMRNELYDCVVVLTEDIQQEQPKIISNVIDKIKNTFLKNRYVEMISPYNTVNLHPINYKKPDWVEIIYTTSPQTGGLYNIKEEVILHNNSSKSSYTHLNISENDTLDFIVEKYSQGFKLEDVYGESILPDNSRE